MSNLFRINDKMMLRLNKNLSDNQNFYTYTVDGNKQYISNHFNNDSIQKTVWNFGPNKTKLNKIYNSTELLNLPDFTISNKNIITGSLLLEQFFSWEEVFGINLIIKSMGNQYNKNILISQIYDFNDFKINFNNSVELISGKFWSTNIDFCIPNLNENIMVYCEIVKFSDIEGINTSTIGTIYNYPINDSSFEPLIGSEIISDNIVTNIVLLPNCFIKIEPKTLEPNKTLEQSIKDYLNLSNNIVDISLEHIIKYGNETEGYKSLKVSNEFNKYGEIIIGLDITEFTIPNLIVFVSTQINCNNKLMIRDNQILFNYYDILNPLIQQHVSNPVNIYPVEVKEINNVSNTIIETIKEKQIVPVFQTIFGEIINENIIFENKNIFIDNLDINKNYYLETQESIKQTILSKNGGYDKIYFDLSELIKPEKNISFNICELNTKKIVYKGNLIVE